MSSKSLKSLLLTIALASPAHHAMASDVSKYSIEKGHLYTQDSASAPSETPFVPWMFEAAVYGDVSAITDVQLTAPPNFASFDTHPALLTSRHFRVPVSRT